MKRDDSDKVINKADIILISAVLLIGAAAFILIRAAKQDGYRVEIRVEGELVKELSLAEEESYICNTSKGQNTIVVKNGEAYVTDADCPDKICEQYKPISEVGEVIICLPHKLVVEVVK